MKKHYRQGLGPGEWQMEGAYRWVPFSSDAEQRMPLSSDTEQSTAALHSRRAPQGDERNGAFGYRGRGVVWWRLLIVCSCAFACRSFCDSLADHDEAQLRPTSEPMGRSLGLAKRRQ